MNMHDVAEFRQHPRMSGFGWMTLVVLGLIGVMAVLGQAGCAGEPVDLGPAREQTLAAQERLGKVEQEQRAALAAAQASGDTEGVAKAEKAIEAIGQARKATDTAGAILTQATNPDGSFNPEGAAGAAGSALMMVNPLLGVGVTLVGGLLGAAWKQRQAREANERAVKHLDAAKQIVRSIEAAKVEVPEFKAAFDLAVPVLNKKQDISTQDLVEFAKLEAKRETRVA